MLRFKCKRCKYLFTDEHLPESPWKQVKEQEHANYSESDKDSTENFIKRLEAVTKNVSCPQCRSTAYLTGVADIKFDHGIDFTGEPLVQLVKGAIDLVKKGQSIDISQEYMEYAQQITEKLLLNPGKLIYFEDPELMREAETALNIIWNHIDEDESFRLLHSNYMVSTTVDYIRRATMLKPTLISVRPDDSISVYFQNAIECWLFGINDASVILCGSIIESQLKQKYPTLLYKSEQVFKNFKDLKSNERNIEEFIDVIAKEGHIDEDVRIMAQNIRKLRNKVVHKLRSVTSEEAYNTIMDTKKIIEQLLK